MDDIRSRISIISDNETLADFLYFLKNDYALNDVGWEVSDIDGYLSSVASWVEDGGINKLINGEGYNRYQLIAASFYIGKIYE